MYIAVAKEGNVVFDYGTEVSYLENGYPVLNGSGEPIAYPTTLFDLFEVESLPEGYYRTKYCYTVESQFQLNPVWNEPTNVYGISDSIFNQILEDYRTTLYKEVQTYGYNA